MVDVILKVKPINADRYVFRSLQNARSAWQIVSGSDAWFPPTDVYETEDYLFIRVEIAGMGNGELSVTLDDQYLLVQGTRPSPKRDCAYHQLEIGYGKFRSAVKLHRPVIVEKAEAAYHAGFLELTVPKRSPQRVEVKE